MLIVDDELGICDFLRTFFSRRGYEVKTVCSGADALTVMPQFQPQVVLLDIRMPGMSGLEVLEQLHPRYPACKVFMVTALDDEYLIAQAEALGAVSYITKPFHLSALERTVMEQLA